MTLLLVPLLSGCLGAVAIPLIAGGTLTAVNRHHVRAATRVSHVASTPVKPKGGKHSESAVPASAKAAITDLKELPPPSGTEGTDAGEPWQAFANYALSQSAAPAEGQALSALLIADPPLDAAARRECTKQVPAVIIDLDNGPAPFDPAQLSSSPAALATGLSRLRAAGVVVLWISQLPASRAADVSQVLRKSGLDPQGQDQLLLLRSRRDRKQLLREDANEDVCVVAIAGDRRSDFDELFDYLRNPDAAAGLDKMIGAGWFIVSFAR